MGLNAGVRDPLSLPPVGNAESTIHRRWKLQYATSHRRVFTVRGSGGSGERVVCSSGVRTSLCNFCFLASPSRAVTNNHHCPLSTLPLMSASVNRACFRQEIGNFIRIAISFNVSDREFSFGIIALESWTEIYFFTTDFTEIN